MTEAEAKTKWCPMVRMYGDDGWTTRLDAESLKTISRDGHVDRATKCIGSACMMWRPDNYRKIFDYATPTSPEGARLLRDQWRFVGIQGGMGCLMIWEFGSVADGYCGLAGKP